MAEFKAGDRELNNDKITTEQDLAALVESVKANANEKLNHVDYSQKLALLSQHALDFTIKGLRNLLRRQKA